MGAKTIAGRVISQVKPRLYLKAAMMAEILLDGNSLCGHTENMTTQALIKSIEKEIRSKKLPAVVLSLEQWEQIEDAIFELSSPELLKSIKNARGDYRGSKAVSYQAVRRGLLR